MNELQHTGVKGMRWGHRKAKNTSNKKDLSHLSNDDLRRAINRKRLEQEYNSIGKPNKQRSSVSDTIQTATKFITSISALTVAGLKVYQISSSVNKKPKNT